MSAHGRGVAPSFSTHYFRLPSVSVSSPLRLPALRPFRPTNSPLHWAYDDTFRANIVAHALPSSTDGGEDAEVGPSLSLSPTPNPYPSTNPDTNPNPNLQVGPSLSLMKSYDLDDAVRNMIRDADPGSVAAELLHSLSADETRLVLSTGTSKISNPLSSPLSNPLSNHRPGAHAPRQGVPAAGGGGGRGQGAPAVADPVAHGARAGRPRRLRLRHRLTSVGCGRGGGVRGARGARGQDPVQMAHAGGALAAPTASVKCVCVGGWCACCAVRKVCASVLLRRRSCGCGWCGRGGGRSLWKAAVRPPPPAAICVCVCPCVCWYNRCGEALRASARLCVGLVYGSCCGRGGGSRGSGGGRGGGITQSDQIVNFEAAQDVQTLREPSRGRTRYRALLTIGPKFNAHVTGSRRYPGRYGAPQVLNLPCVNRQVQSARCAPFEPSKSPQK